MKMYYGTTDLYRYKKPIIRLTEIAGGQAQKKKPTFTEVGFFRKEEKAILPLT